MGKDLLDHLNERGEIEADSEEIRERIAMNRLRIKEFKDRVDAFHEILDHGNRHDGKSVDLRESNLNLIKKLTRSEFIFDSELMDLKRIDKTLEKNKGKKLDEYSIYTFIRLIKDVEWRIQDYLDMSDKVVIITHTVSTTSTTRPGLKKSTKHHVNWEKLYRQALNEVARLEKNVAAARHKSKDKLERESEDLLIDSVASDVGFSTTKRIALIVPLIIFGTAIITAIGYCIFGYYKSWRERREEQYEDNHISESERLEMNSLLLPSPRPIASVLQRFQAEFLNFRFSTNLENDITAV